MLADEQLGRYRIVEKIGSGGMGDVYLAEDTKLKRSVALKTLPPDVALDNERMRRFMHEAKTASGLNHPNIITIYEINDEGETPYIAMEVDSTALRGLISNPLVLSMEEDVAAAPTAPGRWRYIYLMPPRTMYAGNVAAWPKVSGLQLIGTSSGDRPKSCCMYSRV